MTYLHFKSERLEVSFQIDITLVALVIALIDDSHIADFSIDTRKQTRYINPDGHGHCNIIRGRQVTKHEEPCPSSSSLFCRVLFVNAQAMMIERMVRFVIFTILSHSVKICCHEEDQEELVNLQAVLIEGSLYEETPLLEIIHQLLQSK